jgi:hypothetical protein
MIAPRMMIVTDWYCIDWWYCSNSCPNDDDGYDQNGTVSTNTSSNDDECNNYYRQ